MINDYRNNTYQNAVNFNHPYYAYFLYLPAHSISGYSKEAINGFVTNGTGILKVMLILIQVHSLYYHHLIFL